MSRVGGVQGRRCPVSGSDDDNFVKRKILFFETAPGWVRNKDTKCVKLFLNLLVTGRLGFQFLVTGLSPGDTEFVLVDEMARTWSQVKTPVKPGEELAEGEGFEPPVPLRVRLISSTVIPVADYCYPAFPSKSRAVSPSIWAFLRYFRSLRQPVNLLYRY